MNEMEGLRAKVAETRSAALRLSLLLDELDASFRGAGEEPTTASGGNLVGTEVNRNKYGMNRVPATSLQLRIYALGACELFRNLYDFSRVRMTIYQPRLGSVDETSMEAADLYAWAEQELKPRAELAFAGQGEYSVGEWCRSCRARRACRELAAHQLEIAKYEFKEPPLLSDEEMSHSTCVTMSSSRSWVQAVPERRHC